MAYSSQCTSQLNEDKNATQSNEVIQQDEVVMPRLQWGCALGTPNFSPLCPQLRPPLRQEQHRLGWVRMPNAHVTAEFCLSSLPQGLTCLYFLAKLQGNRLSNVVESGRWVQRLEEHSVIVSNTNPMKSGIISLTK